MTAMAMPWPWGGRDDENARDPRAERPRADRFDQGGERSAPWGGRDPRRALEHWMKMGEGRPHGHGRGGRRPPEGPFGGGHGPHMPSVPPGPPAPPAGPWGPPFGYGGPGGPGGPFGGGRGGRRGQRARRGDVRTGILLLLAEGPLSGYEIIREGKERSSGTWRPSPGSVYPMLQQLEDEGLVRPVDTEGGGRRRPFELTEEGRAYVDERGADLTPPWQAAAEEFEDAHSGQMEVQSLAYQLMAAAAQVAQVGTPEQQERAKRMLSETRRELYRILAEDETAPAEESDEDEEE
ncbi:PadR family transcriptional regulator [Nocardiopsis suaedae]|uniref:PadR family transcriptional regulator n=1 Tax=Nocardiopsis suaedae TaxID=3018444 RepID=A0ABT4TSH8_9ACTN|nr:PadR family transcriptional regulator [Nocardiopsis suaedae]MDA2807214.1 PadR family transcriptional regulator [Nocardiopsis suaedae]